MSKLKYRIAQLIGGNYCPIENPSYEFLLECIYNNAYRTIYKVPIKDFIFGIVDCFKHETVEQQNKILKVMKEVVQEALEFSGFELTYMDNDWDELTIGGQLIESHSNLFKSYTRFHLYNKDSALITKHYMCEFFEIQ